MANMTTQRTSLHVVINVPAKSYQKKVPPPTLPKPKVKKYSAEESSELSFPAPPPEAYEPKTDEMQSGNRGAADDELDKLTDLLMKNLENTDDPDFFGKTSQSFLFINCLVSTRRTLCLWSLNFC